MGFKIGDEVYRDTPFNKVQMSTWWKVETNYDVVTEILEGLLGNSNPDLKKLKEKKDGSEQKNVPEAGYTDSTNETRRTIPTGDVDRAELSGVHDKEREGVELTELTQSVEGLTPHRGRGHEGDAGCAGQGE